MLSERYLCFRGYKLRSGYNKVHQNDLISGVLIRGVLNFPKYLSIVYKAAGLGAFQLYDSVDFDNWYQMQLLAELQVKQPRLVGKKS